VSRTCLFYYLQHGHVRGVLLRNMWEQVEAARQLLAEPGPFTTKNLKGRVLAMTSSPKQDS
jgi:3-phenylpropionate/trans-cinnamate dioxygenase ferredoxin reductase subunit